MESLRLASGPDAYRCSQHIKAACDPCTEAASRWMRGGDCTSTIVDEGTSATIEAAIGASTDVNPSVVDIDLAAARAAGGVCNAGVAFGASVVVDGTCYTHVHPHTLTVVDATYWNEDHPGNDFGSNFFPIKRFAQNGGTSAFVRVELLQFYEVEPHVLIMCS